MVGNSKRVARSGLRGAGYVIRNARYEGRVFRFWIFDWGFRNIHNDINHCAYMHSLLHFRPLTNPAIVTSGLVMITVVVIFDLKLV